MTRLTRLNRSTLAALAAVLVFIGLATPKANANPVTWNYVGNPLSNCDALLTCIPGLPSDSLNLSVTFNGPLAGNLGFSELSSDILSWTMTDNDGYINLSQASLLNFFAANFSTDAAGNIIGPYDIQVQYELPLALEISGLGNPLCDLLLGVQCTFGVSDHVYNELEVASRGSGSGSGLVADTFTFSPPIGDFADTSRTNGVWSTSTSTSTVPEPSSLSLLVDFGALAFVFRRRLAHGLRR
jgi:hypothetical protein